MTEQIISTVIALLACIGVSWWILDQIHRRNRQECEHADCQDAWETCACDIRYHLWAGPNKPAVYRCPLCGYILAAWIENGRIVSKSGRLVETQL